MQKNTAIPLKTSSKSGEMNYKVIFMEISPANM